VSFLASVLSVSSDQQIEIFLGQGTWGHVNKAASSLIYYQIDHVCQEVDEISKFAFFKQFYD